MAVVRLATATRNAMVQAAAARIDAGSGPGLIEFYTGSMPSTPADPPGGTLLGAVTFGDPAFGAPSNGSATANALTQDPAADATGQATWARVTDSDGNPVLDCDVGVTGSGAAIELSTVNIVAGGPITITAATLTVPLS